MFLVPASPSQHLKHGTESQVVLLQGDLIMNRIEYKNLFTRYKLNAI